MSRAARIAPLALAWGCVAGPGCAYYSQSDGDRLHDEVYALQQQVTVLQTQLEASEAARREQREIMAKMEDELRKKGGYDADVGVRLDELRTEIARVQGQLGSFDQRASVIEEQTEKSREEIDLFGKRVDVLEGKRELDASQKALLDDPNRALAEAEKLVGGGKPGEARALVRSLEMRQRSESGWGVYAPKAQYLIGESYFAEQKWRSAIAAFNKVRKKYPDAKTWMPGTLLRLGQCLEKLGYDEDAILLYGQAAKGYPKHPNGKEARRRLRQLKKK